MMLGTRASSTFERHGHKRAGLAIMAILAACLPAAAMDHASSQQAVPLGRNDPFAAYNIALDAAASRALRNPNALQEAAPGTAPMGPSQENRASLHAPVHDTGASWQRVEELLPEIEPTLHQVGIPVQLAAVVFVESGGDPMALSPKGARGLWQLMPGTARRYGLTVNAETDQRLDVRMSTRAAAEYLRDLYAEFHDWPLALAAYNAGDRAVQQAMAKTGGRTFSAAASALPSETQKYVPAVLNTLFRLGMGVRLPVTNDVYLEQAVSSQETNSGEAARESSAIGEE